MLLRRQVLLSIGLLVVAGALPASAEATSVGDPVSPQMAITIRYTTPSTHEVCWNSHLRGAPPASPKWQVQTVGVRVAGLPIVDGPRTYDATTVSDCFTVYKDAADAGIYTTKFSYVATGQDIPSSITAVGLWTGTQNNKVESSQ